MFRLLAILLLLAAVALGQDGYGSVGNNSVAQKEAAVGALYNSLGESGQREGTRCPAGLHVLCQSSSRTILTDASDLPVRADSGTAAYTFIGEYIPLAAIIDRDPPVPRSLV